VGASEGAPACPAPRGPIARQRGRSQLTRACRVAPGSCPRRTAHLAPPAWRGTTRRRTRATRAEGRARRCEPARLAVPRARPVCPLPLPTANLNHVAAAQVLSSATVCNACPAGFFTNTDASIICKQCDIGKVGCLVFCGFGPRCSRCLDLPEVHLQGQRASTLNRGDPHFAVPFRRCRDREKGLRARPAPPARSGPRTERRATTAMRAR